jgi:hypothetical protein
LRTQAGNLASFRATFLAARPISSNDSVPPLVAMALLSPDVGLLNQLVAIPGY